MVTGDHPDLDAGRVRRGDCRLRLRPRWVDDAHEGEQGHPVQHGEQVAVRVEGGRVEVLGPGGQDPQSLLRKAFVLGEVPVAEVVVDRYRHQVRPRYLSGTREQLVRRALDEAAHHVLAALVLHVVERRHQLVVGVERKVSDARELCPRLLGIEPALLREDDERALGRVADQIAVRHHGVRGHGAAFSRCRIFRQRYLHRWAE